MATNTQLPLSRRYSLLSSQRDPYLKRARVASALTLPFLIPPQGYTGMSELPTPYQSMGSRGVNNLASRLLMTLFPPNAPFFKFVVAPFALQQIQGLTDNAEEEIKQALLKVEEAIQGELEARCLRPYLHEALKHLVVAGNCVVYIGNGKKQKPRVYHLQNYVVHRCDDRVKCLILEEQIDQDDLPTTMIGRAPQPSQATLEQTPAAAGAKTKIPLYTVIQFNDAKNTWESWQEALDTVIPRSYQTFTDDAMPYIVLRGEVVSGDDYGRSYVDQYIGDLLSLEGLSQAIVEGSAAAVNGRFMVNPNGMTNIDDLSRSSNWAFVPGRGDDVTTMQLSKFADLQVAGNVAKELKQSLALAFLLNSAIQRDAERVTAEEIRQMAQELEQAIGGVYSLMSHEFQLPLVNAMRTQMGRSGILPKLKNSVIRTSVVTGIEALGRGNDLNRLATATKLLVDTLGEPEVVSMIRKTQYATRVYNGAGVSAVDFLKTEQEIAQEQQQATAQAAMLKATPQIASAAGGMMQQQMAAQQAQPGQ